MSRSEVNRVGLGLHPIEAASHNQELDPPIRALAYSQQEKTAHRVKMDKAKDSAVSVADIMSSGLEFVQPCAASAICVEGREILLQSVKRVTPEDP